MKQLSDGCHEVHNNAEAQGKNIALRNIITYHQIQLGDSNLRYQNWAPNHVLTQHQLSPIRNTFHSFFFQFVHEHRSPFVCFR